MKFNNHTFLIRSLFLLCLSALTGCSALDSYSTPSQSTARSLPQIPEIKRQATKPRYVPPQKTVARAPTEPRFVEKSYPKTIIESNPAPQLTQQQKLEQQQQAQIQAKKNATVDLDPYAKIPKSSTSGNNASSGSSTSSSPAIKTLMVSARADIAIGRSRSAISKLERGLRIEPGNAQLWHMLAKAHYSNSAYLHSISMAKKSNANTNNSDLINENWKLIKLAGERSGNASAIKEALDYMKLNP